MAVNPLHEIGSPLDQATPADPRESAIEAALQSLIDLYGPGLLFASGRFERSLRDQFPDAQREISVLVHALAEQVPQELLSVHTDEDLQNLLPQLAQRLSDHLSLTQGAADWAVRTWARGLGLAVFSTGTLPDSLYREGSIAAAVESGIEGATDSAEKALWRRDALVTSRSAEKSGRWRSGPFNLWVTVVATLVAVIAIWFASFYDVLEITRVTSSEPLIGDGKMRDVLMAFTARRVDVESVQIRLVRGDGPPDHQAFTVRVSPEAAAAGLTGAGQIGLRTTTPSTATYEYVLIGTDGKRSAPFEKTFAIAAGPAQPPVITAIAVPHDTVAGQPFDLTIAYGQGSGSIAKIERKVIASTVAWQPRIATTPTSVLPGPKAGAVTYPFGAIAMPSQSTFAFTLVDINGVRSEPRRVAIDVVAPAPPPPRVVSNRCTSATCGRVVAVREVDGKAEASGVGPMVTGFFGRLFGHKTDRAAKLYRITVRMDDGTTQVMSKPTRWPSGARVRVVGNSIVAIGPERRSRERGSGRGETRASSSPVRRDGAAARAAVFSARRP